VRRNGETVSHTQTYNAPTHIDEQLDEIVQRHPDLAFECV
jgi:hypothetical protein